MTMSPPSLDLQGRLAARFSALPNALLCEALAASFVKGVAAAEALIAEQAPLPQHMVAGVLQSPDLLPSLLASLEVDDGAAASVCTAWRQAWRDIDHRVLREVNPPLTQPDGVEVMWHAAAPPSGDYLCFQGSRNGGMELGVYVVDSAMQNVRRVGAADAPYFGVNWLCASEDRIYISFDHCIVSHDVNSMTQVAEHTNEALCFKELALSSTVSHGVLFAVEKQMDIFDEVCQNEIAAFDARSLVRLFSFGRDRFPYMARGLAVGGDAVFVGDNSRCSIHVFSLAGEFLREMHGNWSHPSKLLCFNNRLYLIEQAEFDMQAEGYANASKRILVLTLQGERIQVWQPAGVRELDHVCICGRNLVATVRDENDVSAVPSRRLVALKGT
jgi:hypothetical protein